jgi:hypothetical protein
VVPLPLWYDPAAQQLGADVVEFMARLGEPACLVVPGRDSSRCRMVVTLLHGNEPSGAIALQRWLSDSERVPPAVDVYCVVMNIAAAATEPLFSHRQLPGLRDLNRCFRAPYDDAPGMLAKSLLELIEQVRPEALIDIHNTSGTGPSFGVAVHFDQRHDVLVSYFTERLIITDLRLGALMELSEQKVPSVTIECGGSQDTQSHAIAYEGLMRLVQVDDLFATTDEDWPLDVLHNPVRLELDDSLEIAYAEQHQAAADLSLRVDIERFNFGEVEPSTRLGWLTPAAWQKIAVLNSHGENLRDEYLRVEDGGLFPATRLKLFMITSDAAIAKSDCLLYAVKRSAQTSPCEASEASS